MNKKTRLLYYIIEIVIENYNDIQEMIYFMIVLVNSLNILIYSFIKEIPSLIRNQYEIPITRRFTSVIYFLYFLYFCLFYNFFLLHACSAHVYN